MAWCENTLLPCPTSLVTPIAETRPYIKKEIIIFPYICFETCTAEFLVLSFHPVTTLVS